MRALLAAGADVVRLNAAHGTRRRARATRRAGARRSRTSWAASVGVLVDLPGPKMRTGPGRRRRDRARDRRRAHADRRTRWSATRNGSPRRCRSWAAGSGPATTSSSPTARSCCASTAIVDDDVVCEIVRGGIASLAQGHARSTRRSRTSSRSPTPTRPRSAWRSRSRPTSSACRSCAAPKTSRPCGPGCRSAGTARMLVAKIETAVALDHLPGIVGVGRRGDGRPRRSRHPGAGPACPADPKGDHPVLQHGRQAGDHGHPDARVDDPLAAADPRPR